MAMTALCFAGPAEAADNPSSRPAAPPAQAEPPDPTPEPERPPGGETYVVQAGDWVALIAEREGVTTADIVRLNPEVTAPDYLIVPGQVLVLREPAPILPEVEEPTSEPVADPTTGPEVSLPAETPEPVAVVERVAAPAPSPVLPRAETDSPGDSSRDNTFVDLAIGLGGLAAGLTLGFGSPWLRRRWRGY